MDLKKWIEPSKRFITGYLFVATYYFLFPLEAIATFGLIGLFFTSYLIGAQVRKAAIEHELKKKNLNI